MWEWSDLVMEHMGRGSIERLKLQSDLGLYFRVEKGLDVGVHIGRPVGGVISIPGKGWWGPGKGQWKNKL